MLINPLRQGNLREQLERGLFANLGAGIFGNLRSAIVGPWLPRGLCARRA